MKLTGEVLEKTIETTDFLNGGLFYPEQQDSFVQLIKRYTKFLPMARTVRMKQKSMDVDKLHVSEPITRKAGENTSNPSGTKVKVNTFHLNAKKTQSDWNVTTETLQNNIEGDDFEMTIMKAMTSQIAQDMEHLAIMGDVDKVGNDAVSQLLQTVDGWHKKSLKAHVLDCGGAEIQKGIFGAMKQMLPKQYRNDPNLRFFSSDSLITDWQDLLSGGVGSVAQGAVGADSVAAAAFAGGGAGMNPYGIPLVGIPMIPDDLDCPVKSGPNAAILDGEKFGPFVIVTGSNNVLVITIDANPALTVTFTEDGTYDLVEVAHIINKAFADNSIGAWAEDNGDSRLRIRSLTEGATSVVTLASNATSTANDVFGFDAAGVTVNGAANGGTTPEGSFIWLSNPMNFAWGIHDGTRMFTEFNKDFDRIESVVYNHVDAEIENKDALVIAVNVKRSKLLI